MITVAVNDTGLAEDGQHAGLVEDIDNVLAGRIHVEFVATLPPAIRFLGKQAGPGYIKIGEMVRP